MTKEKKEKNIWLWVAKPRARDLRIEKRYQSRLLSCAHCASSSTAMIMIILNNVSLANLRNAEAWREGMGVYGAPSTPSPEGAGVGHKMASVTKWEGKKKEKERLSKKEEKTEE